MSSSRVVRGLLLLLLFGLGAWSGSLLYVARGRGALAYLGGCLLLGIVAGVHHRQDLLRWLRRE